MRLSAAAGFVLALNLSAAPIPIDEDSPWPRVRSTNGHTVTLHLPQVERWTSNSFTARAAVEVKPAKAKTDLLGVVWFEAQGSVDRSNRIVTLNRLEITKGNFPTATDKGSNALSIVRRVLPAGARTVSLDYLVTALGFIQAAARQGASGLKHEPPQIIWVTNRSVLILIDGEPVLRPVPGTALERVINTPVLLVHDKAQARFYLHGAGQWFAAAMIKGPWGPAKDPPAEVAALAPASTNESSANSDLSTPRIIVSTTPAELLMTSGLPDYRPISGTGLQYVADSDNLLFLDRKNSEIYLLMSGRWFKTKSLYGPWTYVAPRDLPPDFARIPPGSPQAIALASVPGTPQAELAVLANSVPTTATVNRRQATIQLTYDGEPKFKNIEGTQMSYAINAQLPVIRTGENYYALDNGVWFVATSPTGPWQVATEVPDEIYSIPPSSPVYYATFARVYQANDEEVEVGYTAGYQGVFEDDGTVVYGTGWDYEPYYDDDYYGWGWTWGYSWVYVPWYQWWLWRPWWNEPGGLRGAILENIYERWQGRNGVTHHDRSDRTASRAAQAGISFSGHPALYGRFKGSKHPAELPLPANTLAVNPYARPRTTVRPGEMPRGAQLLTTIRQSPGGGRDLYASPDGNVYLRKSGGWYRREASGGWSFFAPTQGTVEGHRAALGGVQSGPGGDVYRPMAARGAGAGNLQDRGDRVPDMGDRVRAQEVADLEREYYARSLAQMRAQKSRPARPARGGRRR
ncbi:MAG: hypothetical protein L0Y58_08860 [Verrucomicrobia subdivision 3 bacterium]|nr:hypothetical protein [Limisphaerales bacterium]